MKIFLSSILLIFISLQIQGQNNAKSAHIHGVISNSTTKRIVLKDNFYETMDSILVNADGSFSKEIQFNSGYIYFLLDENFVLLYLIDKADIDMTIDETSFLSSLKFEGKGAAECTYMVDKKIFKRTKGDSTIYSYYAMLEEADFIKHNENIEHQFMKRLENTSGLSPFFKKLETQNIRIDICTNLGNYEARRKMLTGDKEFKVSNNYRGPFSSLAINRPQLLQAVGYSDYIHLFIDKNTMKALEKNKESDFFVLYLNEIEKTDFHQSIRDRMAVEVSKIAISYSSDIDQFYQKYTQLVKNPSFLSRFSTQYFELKMEAGKPSADFYFYNQKGESYNLASFKGRPTYIDLWATWCRPCLGEIPSWRKLEKEYKDRINFVSISYNDSKSSWEQFLKEESESGIHLFGDDSEHDFFQFYEVAEYGLPRYILLDKNGNIISSKAKRPSFSGIRKIMDNALK